MTTLSKLAYVFIISFALANQALGAASSETTTSKPMSPVPLSLGKIFAGIDSSHPLLQVVGVEKLVAKGRLLRALGAFEPSVANDIKLERFIKGTNQDTQTAGFNDTFLSVPHPSGVKGLAGIRQSIGNATSPDLGFNDDKQQVLLGAFIPLLRGFLVNPENAELERSQLGDPRAKIQIAQTRQDLFLGAAFQYWDWVAAWKVVRVQERALTVAKDRFEQIRQRAKAGASAPLDVIEAEEEVQRRRERMIAAQRGVEQQAFKLSLFLWEEDRPVVPGGDLVPSFPKIEPLPPRETVVSDKRKARIYRPEVRAIRIEAELNDIDLKLAKNNLLPNFDLEAAPARSPEKYVLGLGYRFGVTLSFPFQQRQARGELLEANAMAERLAFKLKFREMEVVTDVDNALSGLERAKERIQAAAQSLRLARRLLKGEQARFDLGATSLLFVNLRERNAVDAQAMLIQVRLDYEKAWAFYRWATGTWAESTRGRNLSLGS